MKISTKGRYALRVMADLAAHREEEPIAMKAVAERQALSLKYLERILPALVKNGLVSGTQGKGGGYRLSRDPSAITVGEVLRLTEGDLAPVACLEANAPSCRRAPDCPTLPLWRELDRRIAEYLDSVTLADLIRH